MLVILDRDGVINKDSDNYIKSPEEWIPYPTSLSAIAQLNKTGHTVIVATNQSGVGRGYYSANTLEKIHDKMKNSLAQVGAHVDAIYICPHKPEDNCACRKPKAGMLEQIRDDYTAEFSDAILVGDSLRDLQAAQAVGVKPILVKTGKGERTIAKGEGLDGISIYADLADVVESFILPGHSHKH